MLHAITDFISQSAIQLVGSIESSGYVGIIILMAIESSFIPFPSEIVMIPAGYLAYQGKMDPSLATLAGIVGSIIGSLINYYLALFCGLPFLKKYGKYFFIKPHTLQRVESIFLKYGDIVIFTSRLIPGIRQLISIPAGIARMHIPKFLIYTSFGAGLWVAILVGFGYWIGSQQMVWQNAWKLYSSQILMGCIGLLLIVIFAYYLKYQKKWKASV